MTATKMPASFIFHGGGPCFFMDWNPRDEWDELRACLEHIGPSLPSTPTAIVVITAHWESRDFAINAMKSPHLVYDYGGFPPHTYQLTYPAAGDPALAQRIASMLGQAGIAHHLDDQRGWDHGVFIPLKVMWPDADIPVVAISVRADFDPTAHLELGRALAPLRDEGVFILGSGASFHNFAEFGSPLARVFDDWLNEVMVSPADDRWQALAGWQHGPAARVAHAREEHLIPLMVAAGAADDAPARAVFRSSVMATPMTCWMFD